MVCLDVAVRDYAVSDGSFTPLSFFAPYIGRSERGDSVFHDAGNYWMHRLCHLYRYNAKAMPYIGGLFIDKLQNEDSGYLPLLGRSVVLNEIKERTPDEIDSLKLHYVMRFIELCRSNGVALVFMVSPSYSMADIDLYDVLKNIAKENGIPFFDYHTDGLFLDHHEYFKDNDHLLDKGARLYTSIFAHDLECHKY